MTTAPTTKETSPARRPLETFRDLLQQMKPQLALAMPRHVDPDRMIRIIFTSVRRNPDLLNCTKESLIDCIIQCTQLGLEFGGPLGHAYPIPFMNRKANPARLECQLIIGYKGLLKLARQSGEVGAVSARVVNAKDFFEYEYGLNEKLRHIPYEVMGENDDPGAPKYAYAIFRLKDGSYHFDVMSVYEIEWIRKASPGANSPAWRDHWDEMAKKTVLRRASKMSPASVEDNLARAIAIDEKADAGLPQELDAGDMQLALGARPVSIETSEPVKEGVRVPLHRPAKPEDAISTATPSVGTAALTAAVPAEEDPDAAARAAVAPTAAEIAAHEAEKRGSGTKTNEETEELPTWAK
jgi:recombination protein RecT